MGTNHRDDLGIDPQSDLLRVGETLRNEFSVLMVPKPANLTLFIQGLADLIGSRHVV